MFEVESTDRMRSVTTLSVAALVLSGCLSGGSDGGAVSNPGPPPPPPSPSNSAPQISGTPTGAINVDDTYSFVPSASDPDGDSVSFRWYPYREVGTFPLEIDSQNLEIRNGDTARATLTAPQVDSARTIHIILEVKDTGEPALTSYRRVIVTVDPAHGAAS